MSEQNHADTEADEPTDATTGTAHDGGDGGDVEAHLAAGQDGVLDLQKLSPEKENSMVSDPAGSGGSCAMMSCC
ncbi:hypothetical protein [Streptomyces mangrovisoli]|uniref:Uncharacterized protein n=1 Tax=Streptomyces mangrovisoli TaxID=1428628 RepID=A0A1J4NPH7_9ACTN|nr:hypothetical protein [Streptomyces mangrovisoli]OIJ64329.1 hypothetical protein WN71_029710 [Streptomyces mangrovisoli]